VNKVSLQGLQISATACHADVEITLQCGDIVAMFTITVHPQYGIFSIELPTYGRVVHGDTG
jgi:hypothetical protein